MGKLTEMAIKNFKVPDDVGKHSDGGGLYLIVSKTGGKSWRFRYEIKAGGKRIEKTLTLGKYPQRGLAQARRELARQKAILAEGDDPAAKRKEDKLAKEKAQEKAEREQQDSFENIALEFLALKKQWSKDHYTQVIRSLKKDAFPAIGKTPITKIAPQDIVAIIRTIEGRGSYEIASKVLQRIRAICSYAVQTGRATSNPASEMKGILKTRPVIHRKALPKRDLPEFFARLSASTDHIVTKAALKFVVLTTVRQGEARHALWPEIDFSSRLWSIPAERMKMRHPHTIYLSDQAIKILQEMKQLATDEEGLVFPGIKNPYKPLSDGTILKSLNSMGFVGKATVHGFRALFSTIANETGRFDKDAIERQLAHREGNQVRAAYHRSEYLEERRRIMVWWGAWLEAIEKNGELVPERDYIPSRISTEEQ